MNYDLENTVNRPVKKKHWILKSNDRVIAWLSMTSWAFCLDQQFLTQKIYLPEFTIWWEWSPFVKIAVTMENKYKENYPK